MKKQILSISIIFILVLSACAQTKKATTSVVSNKINYISMERTACFGQCPHYLIEIYETGLVRYSGKTFADPKGVYEKEMSKETVSEIFKEFNSFRVDTCQEEYTMMVSDLPGLTYIVKYSGNRSKKIHNAHFGPHFLRLLGKEIDSKIKPDNSWKKISDYKEQD